MKIEINQYESYEINFPPKVNRQEFITLAERVNKILRLIGKDELLNLSSEDAKPIKVKNKRKVFATRERAKEALKVLYHGTKENKEEVAVINQIEWNKINNSAHTQKSRYNIKPNEVGMKRYPKVGEANMIAELRQPNFKFKFNPKVWED